MIFMFGMQLIKKYYQETMIPDSSFFHKNIAKEGTGNQLCRVEGKF